jgi:hypothetical protein
VNKAVHSKQVNRTINGSSGFTIFTEKVSVVDACKIHP